MKTREQWKLQSYWFFSFLVIFLLLLVIIGLGILIQGINAKNNNKHQTLPISLHSAADADYSRDFRDQLNPKIDVSIVFDIIKEESMPNEDVDSRIQSVSDVLSSPVPTATPIPRISPSSTQF